VGSHREVDTPALTWTRQSLSSTATICSSGITRLIVIWPPNSKGALFRRIFHP
jgi:hypothetical protein